MSFPRYEEYKDSGVEWLGAVPGHWDVCSFRHSLSSIFNGLTADQIDEGEFTVPVTRIETISSGFIDESRLGFISFRDARHDRKLQVGDVLFSNINSLNMIGNCAFYSGGRELYAGMNSLVLRPYEFRDSRWLYWLVRSAAFRQVVESLAKPAINQASISQASINGIAVAVPSLQEQAKIAHYLDVETAKLDALVEEQKRLIELLKEKRQAVISHAVTKGLNPNAPMKDSGVEWLGEIPAHWIASQLRYVARKGTSITYGIVQAGPHVEDGVPYIRTSDMSGSTLPLSGYAKTSLEIDASYARSRVTTGDLVMTIRASVGKCMPVPVELDGTNLTQGTAKISPGPMIDGGFLLAYINSMPVQTYLDWASKGATFKEITLETLRKTPSLVPPAFEQAEIASRVRSLGNEFQSLIDQALMAVALLSERRTALISAAVTGKIDVRGIATTRQSTVEAVACAMD